MSLIDVSPAVTDATLTLFIFLKVFCLYIHNRFLYLNSEHASRQNVSAVNSCFGYLKKKEEIF